MLSDITSTKQCFGDGWFFTKQCFGDGWFFIYYIILYYIKTTYHYITYDESAIAGSSVSDHCHGKNFEYCPELSPLSHLFCLCKSEIPKMESISEIIVTEESRPPGPCQSSPARILVCTRSLSLQSPINYDNAGELPYPTLLETAKRFVQKLANHYGDEIWTNLNDLFRAQTRHLRGGTFSLELQFDQELLLQVDTRYT
jgi:hypothetical protein